MTLARDDGERGTRAKEVLDRIKNSLELRLRGLEDMT